MLLSHETCRRLFGLLLPLLLTFTVRSQELIYARSYTEHITSDQDSLIACDAASDSLSPLFTGFEYIPAHAFANASPFFETENDLSGSLTYFSRHFTNVPLRYDMENDQLVFFPAISPYRLVLVTGAVSRFQYGQHVFVQRSLVDPSGKAGFLEELYMGKDSRLLAEHRKIPEEKIRDLKVKFRYREETNYFLFHDGKLLAIRSVRDILQQFPQRKAASNTYLRQQHISSRSTATADFIQLLTYYESLP